VSLSHQSARACRPGRLLLRRGWRRLNPLNPTPPPANAATRGWRRLAIAREILNFKLISFMII